MMATNQSSPTKGKRTTDNSNASGGAVYALGLIGAAVYYIQAAEGFTEGALGLLKALFWPAFLVYELLLHTSL